MSETVTNPKGQKPENSKLAIAIAIAGLLIILVWLLLPSPIIQGPLARQIVCISNLRVLGMAIMTYSELNDGKHPTPDKWCDLLVQYADVNEEYIKYFKCPANNKDRCSYAINPNAGPNSPNDIVLLFETTGGWNQFGGSELLTIDNHKGKGCSILFNNGDVKFVETEHLGGLKWKAEDAHQGDKTHLAATTATLKKLHSAVCEFYMDTGRFPTDEEGLMALIKKPSDVSNYKPGGYLEYKKIPKDAWGNEFVYKRSPESGKGFVIISPGLGNEEKGDGGCPEELYSTHP
jgi:type II secretion system protein G